MNSTSIGWTGAGRAEYMIHMVRLSGRSDSNNSDRFVALAKEQLALETKDRSHWILDFGFWILDLRFGDRAGTAAFQLRNPFLRAVFRVRQARMNFSREARRLVLLIVLERTTMKIRSFGMNRELLRNAYIRSSARIPAGRLRSFQASLAPTGCTSPVRFRSSVPERQGCRLTGPQGCGRYFGYFGATAAGGCGC